MDDAEQQRQDRELPPWPPRETARSRELNRARKALEEARVAAVVDLKAVRYSQRHAAWLIERFPESRYRDVQGLCKVVKHDEIEAADWSLTPGRYVGVAAAIEDEDFDFAESIRDIKDELEALNRNAVEQAGRIQHRLAELLA